LSLPKVRSSRNAIALSALGSQTGDSALINVLAPHSRIQVREHPVLGADE
jgi:hypothetical protein